MKRSSPKSGNFSTNNHKSSQDWLGLEEIYQGIAIFIENGQRRYVKILEVEPASYHLKTKIEKEEMINEFYRWTLQSPIKFQICITTRKHDTDEMVSRIQDINKDKSLKRLEAKNDYLSLIEDVSSNKSVRKHFLLVMQYETGDDGFKSKDKEVIARQFWTTIMETEHHFSNMGTPLVLKDETMATGEVLYKYLNKKTSKTLPFRERIQQVYDDACEIQKTLSPIVDEASYVASNGLNTKKSNGYIIADGMYQTFLYIRQDGYISMVPGGWVSLLTNYGENVDLTMHFLKKNREQTLGVLSQTKKGDSITSRKANREGDEDKAEEYATKVRNASYIQQCMKHGEDLYDAFFLFTITANSYKELIREKARVKRQLKKDKFYVSECYAMQEDAYRMSLPINYTSSQLMGLGRRNFVNSTIASTFPFTAYEVYNPQGELWGVNLLNGTAVSIDLYDTKRLINANMTILGSSGAGKTYTEQCLGGRMCLNGRKTIFILPIKGHEYKRKCEAIGGTYIQLRPNGKHCVNIFGIMPADQADNTVIDELVYGSLLSAKITQLKTFFSLLLKDRTFSEIEDSQLDVHLTNLYEKFGITNEDNSIFDSNGNLKVMPTFSDFKEEIQEDLHMESLLHMLYKFTDGSCKNMDGQTNVDFNNDYIVFDVNLDYIPENLKAAFLFMAVDAGYTIAKESRTEEVVLFLDEIWQMMINKQSAEFIFKLTKIVRGYASSCILATQDIEDLFKSGDIGVSIINNCETKLILRTKPNSIAKLKDILALNKEECGEISKFRRGQGMLMLGDTRLPIYIETTTKELRETTTDKELIKHFEKLDEGERSA